VGQKEKRKKRSHSSPFECQKERGDKEKQIFYSEKQNSLFLAAKFI
jgi:hypothetical protein